jgi:hypothetical protein
MFYFSLVNFYIFAHLKRSIVITPRQRLFFQFASIEYEGIPYMTPQDFLESVTENHPRRNLCSLALAFSLRLRYLYFRFLNN